MKTTTKSGTGSVFKRINWLKFTIVVVVAIVLSIGLTYLLKNQLARYDLSNLHNSFVVYLALFGIAILVNLSFVPVPVAISLMIALSATFNPLLVALVASLGACIGEMSGYVIGYLGKKVAIPEGLVGYESVHRWVEKFGVWAIAFLSFQPVLPIEVGGIVAGASRMLVYKFLPALWLGKFPKYLILIYAGDILIKILPFLR